MSQKGLPARFVGDLAQREWERLDVNRSVIDRESQNLSGFKAFRGSSGFDLEEAGE